MLAKASRTKYQSNQIGQFSANKFRTRIELVDGRERERAIGRCAGKQKVKKKKWFNLAVVLLQPSHQGKALSNFFVCFIKLSVWVGRRVAVSEDRSLGAEKWYPCVWGGEVTKSHRTFLSCNNIGKGREGVWLITGRMDNSFFLLPFVLILHSVHFRQCNCMSVCAFHFNNRLQMPINA